MHYQSVVNPADKEIVETKNVLKADIPNAFRYVTKFKDYDEEVMYDVYKEHVVIIKETEDGSETVYHPEGKYEPKDLGFLVEMVCLIHKRRVLQFGQSIHTVTTHEVNNTSRFIPILEAGKVYLHERKGEVFKLENDFYVALPDEVIHAELTKVLAQSIKIFNKQYLVRFKENDKFVYFQLDEVFADPDIRIVRNRRVPNINQYCWANKRYELEKHLIK